MSVRGFFKKVLAVVVATTVFCQTAVLGTVLCIHADGTERFENFAEQTACHAKNQETQTSIGASSSCTDRVLSMEALAARADSLDSLRLALSPPLLAFLPWTSLFQATEVTQQFAAAASSPAFSFDQHARIISSTVILI